MTQTGKHPDAAGAPSSKHNADSEMLRHFVTFFSPGTFMAEDNTEQVESWDVKAAVKRASEITQRYNAIPYGFRFYTMERRPGEWEPKRTATSPTYYLPHCKVETLAEIEARNDPNERVLRLNMRSNGIDRVVVTTKGWRWTQPLRPDDVVLT